jgi:hypothetical protein
MPRVMNVDQNPAYPAAVEALKDDGAIPRRVVLRQCKYLNSLIEQDHRTAKKRVWLAKGYGTFSSAWRTLQGIETVNMIRKGRVRWLAQGDAVVAAGFWRESPAIAPPGGRLSSCGVDPGSVLASFHSFAFSHCHRPSSTPCDQRLRFRLPRNYLCQ